MGSSKSPDLEKPGSKQLPSTSPVGCILLGLPFIALQSGALSRRRLPACRKVIPCIDRTIGKPVLQVGGTIPAVNYIQLPSLRSHSLGLTGQYLYCQVLLDPAHPFVIHVDTAVQHAAPIRISISNLFQADTRKLKQGSIHMAYSPSERGWLLLALDLVSLLAAAGRPGFQEVRGLQLCATLSVRTVFTSDLAYSREALPRAMKIPGEKGEAIALDWLPRPPLALIHARWPDATADTDPPRNPDPAPDAFLELERIHGFTGEYPQALLWPAGSEEVIFASSTTIIVMTDEGKQRYLLGHTSPVCSLAACQAAGLLASAEDGRQALIRLWHLSSGTCLCLLNGHVGGSKVDIAADGNKLAAVGRDSQRRQTIVVWDISGALTGRMACVIARHTTDYHASCIRFCPFEPGRLITCGRSSIRIYRLKDGVLRGLSIQLGVMDGCKAGQGANIFTDIAFEMGQGLLQLHDRHFYVSSAAGSVCQVNYGRRTLERIYQLHTGAINHLALHEGFCVTASDDRFLRIWPLDFSDFLLEAEHEAPPHLAVGSAEGRLRVFDTSTRAVIQEMSQHHTPIVAVCYQPSGQRLFSLGMDGGLCVYSTARLYIPVQYVAPAAAILSLSEAEALPLTRSRACMCIQPQTGHVILARPSASDGRQEAGLEIQGGDPLELKVKLPPGKASITAMACCPRGRILWAVNADRTLLSISLSDGKLIQEVPGCHRLAVTSLAVSRQGDLLASGGADGLVKLWSLLQAAGNDTAGGPHLRADRSACQSFIAHPDAVTSICFVGEDHLISTSAGDTVAVWRITPHALSASRGSLLVLEDLTTRCQRWLSLGLAAAGAVALTPAGSTVAMATRSSPQQGSATSGAGIQLWSAASGAHLQSMHSQHCHAIQELIFSPSSIWLLSIACNASPEAKSGHGQAQNRDSNPSSVIIWDVASGHAAARGSCSRCIRAACWREGSQLPQFLTASQEGLLLWQLGPSELTAQPVQLDEPLAFTSITALQCSEPGKVTLLTEAGALWQLGGLPPILSLQDPASSAAPVVKCSALQCYQGSQSTRRAREAPNHLALATGSAIMGSRNGSISLATPSQVPEGEWKVDMVAELDGPVTSLQGGLQRREAVVGTASGTIWYVDMEGAHLQKAPILAGPSAPITSITPAAFSAQGEQAKHIATTAEDGLLRVFRRPSAATHPSQAVLVAELQAGSLACQAACFTSFQGQDMVVGAYEDGCLRFFALPDGGLVATSAPAKEPLCGLVPSPHTPHVLALARDGLVLVCNAATGHLVHSGKVPAASPGAAFSCLALNPCPGSSGLGSSSQHQRQAQQLIAAAGPKQCTVLRAPWGHQPYGAAVTHESCGLVSSYVLPQTMWSSKSEDDQEGATACTFISCESSCILFSSALQDGILVLDYTCGQLVRKIALAASLTAITIHPSGSHAVVASCKRGLPGALSLLDLQTWSLEPVDGSEQGEKILAANFHGQNHVLAAAGSQLLWFQLS
ncbi:hypothetical protein WJX84_006024 [Apatococcus fuscideae]|uniref:CFA20 domain-containing protein n=1 Tax=Apatococcus fuscideae TaxID=2026836 RepID=A0AAW1S472_9CHLO